MMVLGSTLEFISGTKDIAPATRPLHVSFRNLFGHKTSRASITSAVAFDRGFVHMIARRAEKLNVSKVLCRRVGRMDVPLVRRNGVTVTNRGGRGQYTCQRVAAAWGLIDSQSLAPRLRINQEEARRC